MNSGTETDIKRWVAGTRPYNWYNQCAGLTMSITRHFGNGPALGAPGVVYATARDAYNAAANAGPIRRDASEAPAGAIHYWDYTTTINGRRKNFGHVVVDIRGGGTHTLSATRLADPEWGENAGLISVARQTAAIGSAGRYLGWSPTYGAKYIVNIEPEGGGSVTPPVEEEVPDIVYKEFKQTKPQEFAVDKPEYLRLNDNGDATVASGPLVVGAGVLSISGRAEGDGPFDTQGFVPVIQVQPVLDTVENGVTKSASLGGLVEIVVTQGVTAGQVAIPPITLREGHRLRFKVTVRARDKFTLGSTSVRLSTFSPAK